MAKSVYPLPGDQMEERLRRSEMEERDQRGRVEDKERAEGAHFKRFLKGKDSNAWLWPLDAILRSLMQLSLLRTATLRAAYDSPGVTSLDREPFSDITLLLVLPGIPEPQSFRSGIPGNYGRLSTSTPHAESGHHVT